MGTLRMCYEYIFQIFTKSLLLSMHISTVSILQNLFLDKLLFLNFYQFRPYHYPSSPTSLFIDHNGSYPALHNLPAELCIYPQSQLHGSVFFALTENNTKAYYSIDRRSGFRMVCSDCPIIFLEYMYIIGQPIYDYQLLLFSLISPL